MENCVCARACVCQDTDETEEWRERVAGQGEDERE